MAKRRHMRGRASAWGFALLGMSVVAGLARASNPNVLWTIVHDRCVPDMKTKGLPAPCAAVHLAQGYAVLKDLRGAFQFLVIPTQRITGIEDPKLLATESPNYWRDAWGARRFVEQRSGRSIPRENLALAVNSVFARSQNQLHIHVDCIRVSVRQALNANESRIGPQWSKLDFDLAGYRYHAMRIEQSDLGPINPFKLLANGDAEARAHMGEQTLALVGATFSNGKPGFILLNDHADLATMNRASAEELLDHACKILHPG